MMNILHIDSIGIVDKGSVFMDRTLINSHKDSLFQLKCETDPNDGRFVKNTYYIYKTGNKLSDFIIAMLNSDDDSYKEFNIIFANDSGFDEVYHDLQVINDVEKFIIGNTEKSCYSRPVYLYIPKNYIEAYPRANHCFSYIHRIDNEKADNILLFSPVYNTCGDIVYNYRNRIIIDTKDKVISSRIVHIDSRRKEIYTPDTANNFDQNFIFDTAPIYVFDKSYD